MSIQDTTGYHPVLTVTDAARAEVLSLRSEEAEPERLALWVEVTGSSNGAYTYDIYFEATADATASDAVQHDDDLPVVIPETSVERLRGATLDMVEGGLAIVNPNTPPVAPGVATPNLTSDAAKAVMEVLEEEINPSIAAHGGAAELVSVDDGVAYVRMLGGCQGCGLASMTLNQGIATAIKDRVPEITDVVDVTDHAQGTNPYYTPSKK